MKDQGGKILFEKEAQAKRWVEDFKSFLNRPPPCNQSDVLPARNDFLPICRDLPFKEEIGDAIKRMNRGKATVHDIIPADTLKVYAHRTAYAVHPLFVKIWTEGKFSSDWNEGHLVKIPKK